MKALSENQVKGQVLDHHGLIAATIEKLGLIDKTDKLLPLSRKKGAKVTMGQRLAAMILNGLGFIDDRLYLFPSFLANKPIERLLGEGLSAENFNDDVLGRFLDTVYTYGTTKFFTQIAFEVGIENNFLGKTAHFDTSSLSVYGDYCEKELNVSESEETAKTPIQITYGYSKANRPDLKQMVINLATTGAAGFPVWMESHSGNASDKKIMLEAAKKMQAFCKGLREAPDFLYVGDSAFYENSVKHGGGMKWLSRVPQKLKEARILLGRRDEEFCWMDQGKGYRITSMDSDYGKVKQRWLLVHSEQAFLRETKRLNEQIVCENNELEKKLWHLSNERFKCEADAKKSAENSIKGIKYHQVKFSILVSKKYESKGRPKKGEVNFTTEYSLEGLISRDEAKIALAQRKKGRFLLATNELDKNRLPDDEILVEYKGQSKTETGFRFIKGHAFEVSSVFLKKAERIEALMMVMTLCLLVYSVAQHHLREALMKSGETVPNQLKKPTQKPSMSWVCRLFHGVQLIQISYASSVQKLVINLTDTTKQIIRYFGSHAEYIYGLSSG